MLHAYRFIHRDGNRRSGSIPVAINIHEQPFHGNTQTLHHRLDNPSVHLMRNHHLHIRTGDPAHAVRFFNQLDNPPNRQLVCLPPVNIHVIPNPFRQFLSRRIPAPIRLAAQGLPTASICVETAVNQSPIRILFRLQNRRPRPGAKQNTAGAILVRSDRR